jgi:purine-binding chemotaxis protein CheW
LTSITPQTDASDLQLLVLEVAGVLYAVESRAVREIVPTTAATRLPGAPPHVRGLVNLRGTLVTVVDLVQRLAGQSARETDGSTIVLQATGRVLGVAVDDVHDVQSLPSTAMQPAPATPAGSIIQGMGHFGDAVVIVVDVHELVRQTLG